MAAYLLNLLTPATCDAANALHQKDADALARLTVATRRAARRKAGDKVDASDVAQVAALVAAPLVLAGRSEDDAARIACHRATVAALRDAGLNEDADRLDKAGDNAAEPTPLARLAAPAEVRADRGTSFTDRDRIADALDAMDEDDRERVALVAALDPGKANAGTLPTRALLLAAGWPAEQVAALKGRALVAAGEPYRAAVAEFAATYRTTLTHAAWTRSRAPWTEDAATLAAALVEDAASSGPARRDSMSRAATISSGTASQPVARHAGGTPALVITDDSGRDTGRRVALQASEAGTVLACTTALPAAEPHAWTRRAEQRRAEFEPVAADQRSAAAVKGARPGITVGAGEMAGQGTPFVKVASSKRKRDGAIGGSMTRA